MAIKELSDKLIGLWVLLCHVCRSAEENRHSKQFLENVSTLRKEYEKMKDTNFSTRLINSNSDKFSQSS